MRYFDVVAARCRTAMIVGLTACCNASVGAEPVAGTATIGTPVVAVTAPMPTDDSTRQASIVPTPIVPYASKGTDLEPGPKEVVAGEPTTPAVPPPIDAGDLVPVTIPKAPNGPARPETLQVAKPAASIDSNVESPPAAEALTPIRRALMSREVPPAPTIQEKKATRAAATVESAAPDRPSQLPERAEPPAVRFSFPQPVIPLESALRRGFGRTLGR